MEPSLTREETRSGSSSCQVVIITEGITSERGGVHARQTAPSHEQRDSLDTTGDFWREPAVISRRQEPLHLSLRERLDLVVL